MTEVVTMWKGNFITKTANTLCDNIMEKLVEIEESNNEMLKSIKDCDFDIGFGRIEALVNCIGASIKDTTVDGVGLPAFLTKVTATEGKLDEVDITVKSKLKAKHKVKATQTVKVDEDFVEVVGKLFTDTLFNMFYLEVADANITELNEKIASIFEEENIPYTLEFEVTTDSGRVIYIDNNKVVLKARLDEALAIGSNGLFANTDDESRGYDKIVYEEARNELVSVMRTVQITPEILKKKIRLVESLADLHTKKYAHKLIREGYHKKAENLKDSKSGVGYFSDKVTIDGEEVDVFALLKKNDSGEYEVVLSPFDTKTNVSVDFDVVKALA